ncbi:MAG: antA/AntB antirepressor family protein [Planctomycetia bacterium]
MHGFLGVASEFRHWIKNRIADFGFVENVDFATLVEIYRGGERKNYHLTLDVDQGSDRTVRVRVWGGLRGF